MPIDPLLAAQIGQGKAAGSRLNSIRGSGQMARALRDYQTPLPGVQGRGLAATAPSLIGGIGALLLREKGSRDIGGMAEQAKTLRGDIATGAQAEEEAKASRAQLNFERNQQLAQEAQAQQMARSKMQEKAQAERSQQDRESRERIAALKAAQARSTSGLKPTGSERKTYIEAGRLGGIIEGLNQSYTEMEPDVQAQLDQPIKEGVLSFLPSVFQRLGEEEIVESPAAKSYKTRISRLESKLSQLASGLAVTGYEMKDRQKWSPNAPGITQAERQRRLDNIQKDLTGEREAFKQYYPNYAGPTIELAPQQEKADAGTSRTIGNTTYIKRGGEWYVED